MDLSYLRYNNYLDFRYQRSHDSEDMDSFATAYIVPVKKKINGTETIGEYVVKFLDVDHDAFGRFIPGSTTGVKTYEEAALLLNLFEVGNILQFKQDTNSGIIITVKNPSACGVAGTEVYLDDKISLRDKSFLGQMIMRGGSKKHNTNDKKETKEKVMVQGRSRIVYTGSKGGKYIKMNGGFVRLNSLKRT